MFEDSLFAGKARTIRPATVALSFLLQTLTVAVMILIPLVYPEVLPRRWMSRVLITTPAPPAPRPATTPPVVRIAARPVPPQRELTQPVAIPARVAPLREEPLPPIAAGVVTDPAALAEHAPTTLLSETFAVEPPSPPVAIERIKVGGQVAAARLVSQPTPVYPTLARQVHVQGTVRLQAIISKDGTIQHLTVLSGHPLLIPAALDAVQQWRYQPTQLNGVPLEVETTIDVNFTLGG